MDTVKDARGEDGGRPEKPAHRVPLGLVSLVLYTEILLRFVGAVLFDPTADGLVGALIRMVVGVGMTTAFVKCVLLYRRRRERRGG
ncbi:hypothetical protein [Streptomyces geranii]|uniref:hypothetical protein n=1 Tax=Streptomyces geranii TaxID=2058923 RepID=UPI000D0290D9|nr:hypothetical protein [Streptomyces geranii]